MIYPCTTPDATTKPAGQHIMQKDFSGMWHAFALMTPLLRQCNERGWPCTCIYTAPQQC